MFRVVSGTLACAVLAFPLSVLAAAVVYNKQGDVQSAVAPSMPAPVTDGQRIAAGARVTTAGGKAILRFDDGLQVALEADTVLRIVDYRYSEASAAADNRIVLELERGAVRVVTGWMVARDPATFTLRGPQAQITVRGGADFTVVLVNPMYVSVQVGSVITSNAAGKLALAEGSRVAIATANATPLTVTAAALPAPAAAAMQNLQLAGLTTPGAAATGALPTTAGAAGGVGAGTGVLALGAGLAGAAALAGDDDQPASATTHH